MPVGHAIDRPGQRDLSGVPSSGGLFAPTLRHHDGVFFLVNTLVNAGDGVPGGNCLLTAGDPAGPWSEPVWLTDAEGIDPWLSSTTTAAPGMSGRVRARSRPGTDRPMCGCASSTSVRCC